MSDAVSAILIVLITILGKYCLTPATFHLPVLNKSASPACWRLYDQWL